MPKIVNTKNSVVVVLAYAFSVIVAGAISSGNTLARVEVSGFAAWQTVESYSVLGPDDLKFRTAPGY